MLVYVNNFNCTGSNSFLKVQSSILGWLNRVSGLKLNFEQLSMPNDISCDNGAYIRTYVATRIEPEIYSVMYTHPDNQVSGRQWITEIGVRKEENNTFISVLLQISDVSTMVVSRPLATRPLLVKYLKENCIFDTDVIGQKVDYISGTTGDYRYLNHEIHRDTREYPILFVSRNESGEFKIPPEVLQEQLLGLAQVVATTNDIDSWEMERVLGRRLSAWGGAINLIYPPHKNGEVRSFVILYEKILEMEAASEIPLKNYLLSIITHSLNGFKKKKHISPVLTRSKRQRDENLLFRNRIASIASDSEYKDLLDEAMLEIENIKQANDESEMEYIDLISNLENDINDSKVENTRILADLERLRFESKHINKEISESSLDIGEVLRLATEKLTPHTVLMWLGLVLPENVIVLDDAIKSAKKSSKFQYSGRLMMILYELSTTYLSEFIEKGDNSARKILGDAYSANESEFVESSPKLSVLRQFNYNGQDIKMFKHIGIGVARNKTETIRVHFHVDVENKRIVIGYCGEHLPVQSS